MKLTGNRGKIYRQLLKEGKTEAYSRRISKGLAEGKSLSVARGHKEERYRKLPGAYQKAPRGRLEKKKEEQSLYSYFDPIRNKSEEGGDSEILGMTSYDLTKTTYKKYDNGALFDIHQHLERQIQHYLKMNLIVATQDNMNVEDATEIRSKHRRFLWQLTDFETGDIIYHLIYEKGELVENKMWEDFNKYEFLLEIKGLKKWE